MNIIVFSINWKHKNSGTLAKEKTTSEFVEISKIDHAGQKEF